MLWASCSSLGLFQNSNRPAVRYLPGRGILYYGEPRPTAERRDVTRLSRDQLREMVRQQPDYQKGHISDEQAEEIVEDLFERQEELFEEFVKAEAQRELIRMVNRGELEYDPEDGTYRMEQS
jgi:hypothetical protein